MNQFMNHPSLSTQTVSSPRKMAGLASLSLLVTLGSVEGKSGGLEYGDDGAD
jgi:hypothetical protein